MAGCGQHDADADNVDTNADDVDADAGGENQNQNQAGNIYTAPLVFLQINPKS